MFVNGFVGVLLAASQYRHGLHWASWWSCAWPSRIVHFLPTGSGKVDLNLLLLISAFGVLGLLSVLVVYLAAEKS